MKEMSLIQIATAVNGTYHGETDNRSKEITGVSIDSRKINTDYLFVPIKGERVDGHDFIAQVAENGALCTLCERPPVDTSISYILVDSCLQALKDLAKYYRSTLDIKVIGITGSVGKTSTKEMIAAILSQKFKVLKTEGNYNNEIGLPLTIFRIKETHEIAILEMGISNFGEMHTLADIARPDIGIITNIGFAHIEYLKDQAGILKAKTEMFDHLNPDATVVLNGDDALLSTISSVQGRTPVFFGLSDALSVYADNIETKGIRGTSCTLHLPGETIPVNIPLPGTHMVYNALAGAYIGHLLGLTGTQIKIGIASAMPIAGRTNVIKTDSIFIIDDCYNANPASMKGAIDLLSEVETRSVAILGDMFELGDEKETMHHEIGTYASRRNVDLICCVGELSKHMYHGAKEAATTSQVHYFPTKDELLEGLPVLLEAQDTILVKASNGMKFTEIISNLKCLVLDSH